MLGWESAYRRDACGFIVGWRRPDEGPAAAERQVIYMASVKGIGGAFIDSADAPGLANWYAEMLGVELEMHPDGTGYYCVFPTRDAETSILRWNPVFAINQAQEKLADTGRGFVLNLRVDNLTEFLDELRMRGVEVEDRLIVWERGKHAWIRDKDGNRVELYEELQPEDEE